MSDQEFFMTPEQLREHNDCHEVEVFDLGDPAIPGTTVRMPSVRMRREDAPGRGRIHTLSTEKQSEVEIASPRICGITLRAGAGRNATLVYLNSDEARAVARALIEHADRMHRPRS